MSSSCPIPCMHVAVWSAKTNFQNVLIDDIDGRHTTSSPTSTMKVRGPINFGGVFAQTQFPPSRLKFDTKLRKVFPNNLVAYIALHKSFSQGKYCTQFCLFVLANHEYKHLKLIFLATFGTCYSSQMPSSRLKCGKKLRNTSLIWFVSTALHKSLLQATYVEYCM